MSRDEHGIPLPVCGKVIKPEDVPDEVAEDVKWLMLESESGGLKSDLAIILNAAIEAGIVSPSCWAVKHCNGVLFGIFGTETEAKLNSSGDDVVEHWIGYGH